MVPRHRGHKFVVLDVLGTEQKCVRCGGVYNRVCARPPPRREQGAGWRPRASAGDGGGCTRATSGASDTIAVADPAGLVAEWMAKTGRK
jgi:hypothetical protein